MPSTLTRYNSQAPVSRLPDMIDQLFKESFVVPMSFERFFGGRTVNFLETESSYIFQFTLPGLELDTLQIQVTGQQLSIKAVCVIPTVENAVYLYHGLTTQEFTEVFSLPTDVDGEKAEAVYTNGILSITLPKAEYAKPKMVKVTTT